MAILAPGPRLGFVLNPIAGMGGTVALRGSDGAEVLARALRLGARPVARKRARHALRAVAEIDSSISLLAAPGVMGCDLAEEVGLPAKPTGRVPAGETSADDTREAARVMVEAGVDLLLFAGGDGTARDIHGVVDEELPVLGIPTGVKMHSGVFAATPTAAGELAAKFLKSRGAAPTRLADVADVDEACIRAGQVSAQLCGVARVPSASSVLGSKSSQRTGDAELEAACAEVAAGLDPGAVYLFGPGSTTQRVLDQLGLQGALMGVDAVKDGRLIGLDLHEAALLELVSAEPDVRLVLGVIGGQGSLLGRGNQQLSPKVLRRARRDQITVVAGEEKLVALQPPVLRVDTGYGWLDRQLSGYIRVRVAPRRTMLMKVVS